MRVVRTKRRWLCSLSLLLAFGLVSPAIAEQRTVYDHELTVLGVRVAKSGSARLAEATHDDVRMLEQPVYVLAGTRLVVFEESAHDDDNRPWNLAFTQDGLLLYVRPDGTHYFDKDTIDSYLSQYRAIAIAETTVVAETGRYGAVDIFTSQIFPYEPMQGEDIRITIGRDSIGERYAGDDTAVVDSGEFAVVGADQLTVDAIIDPFVEFDLQDRIQEAKEAVLTLGRSEAEKSAFVDYLDLRFVTEKKCDQAIELKWDFDGNAAVEFSNILSPLTVGLGLNGSYTNTTTFGAGTEFEIQRYRSGDEVVEIKDERLHPEKDCTQPPDQRRVVAYQKNKREGELNRPYLINDLDFTENGLPIYTCRDQYLSLMHSLTRDQELDRRTAALLIANFARYEGAGDAAECAERASDQELVPRPRPDESG